MFTLVIVFSFSILTAEAQTINQSQEAIVSYKSDIVVNIDNSINVTEEIIYQTGLTEHHGIYRDIHPYSSLGKKMGIKDVIVADESGKIHTFQIQGVGKDIRIKIGDPEVTFLGEKTYIIKYRATNAVAKLDEIDEIYWNATGNDWGMPIYSATATVSLPNQAQAIQKACYFGPKGSTDKCLPFIEGSVSSVFMAPTVLNPGAGLTVAVGFNKGVTHEYPAYIKILDQFFYYLPWMIAIALPVVTFILSFRYWQIKGRDPKGSGVIVPQYDVPDGLTPMEVLGILKESISAKSISAEIIYLATMGYLKIVHVEKKNFGFFKTTDYDIVKLKDFSDIPNNFDKELIETLFSATLSNIVRMSKLKNVFYKQIPAIIKSTMESLFKKGYYRNLGKMGMYYSYVPGVGKATALLVAVFVLLVLSVSRVSTHPQIAIGIFVSAFFLVIVYHLSPAKTEKGVAVKEYLLGLKMYLQIAEKDRLQFHNAPEKKPEIFEKLLPYAVVFGVEKAWAKEFEGIYVTPPSWYDGPVGTNFSAGGLSTSLAGFSSFASSSLKSSPSSSGGSGGGGSSGGGGGGGGGGSW